MRHHLRLQQKLALLGVIENAADAQEHIHPLIDNIPVSSPAIDQLVSNKSACVCVSAGALADFAN